MSRKELLRNKKGWKNFGSFCMHLEGFQVCAALNSLATSHGKGPCDGIGGSVKKLATKLACEDHFAVRLFGRITSFVGPGWAAWHCSDLLSQRVSGTSQSTSGEISKCWEYKITIILNPFHRHMSGPPWGGLQHKVGQTGVQIDMTKETQMHHVWARTLDWSVLDEYKRRNEPTGPTD